MAAHPTYLIAGGGAAGFFAAIHAAQARPDARVVILEKSREPLAKVALSGGGRCNLTHACFDPADLIAHYPRGGRELLGLLHRWGPRDTIDWFETRGVTLKTEPDGRVFPVSNRSADVVHTLRHEADRLGVELQTGHTVDAATAEPGGGFQLHLRDGESLRGDALMLATGGNQTSPGFAVAAALGHTVEPPVPSLFTFHVRDARIDGLQGLSVPAAHLTVDDQPLAADGPLLITHQGFSGPAVLRLSAWGARRLAALDYHFTLRVRWRAGTTAAGVRDDWMRLRQSHGRKTVHTSAPDDMPQRLWAALATAAGVPAARTWSTLTRDEETRLSAQWLDSPFTVHGKTPFKEEFVTCGGVRLNEVDFRTMASRRCPGLFLGGELLDIDGLTGGFNLQAAWATGRTAGLGMAARP
jgi:predicted Rossmann fold flavoprotein